MKLIFRMKIPYFLQRRLHEFDLDIPFDTAKFIELIEACITDNVFEYNAEIYLQKYVLSMGSPLSPVLCGLFMEYLESELLPTISDIKWFRYVDDIFLIWPDNLDFDTFFHRFNNLHPTIKFKFKFKWEVDGTLLFLDIKVHKTSSKTQFSIYRKSTNLCAYIHNFSMHST